MSDMLHERLPLAISASLLALGFAQSAFALDVPVNDGFVTDAADILSVDEEERIEEDLTNYQRTTSNEIAVLTIPSLSGAVITDVGVEVFRKWGIGSAENNNGLLLIISYADREIGLTTGYGLEGAIPDIVSKGIMDTDIVPHLREGEFGKGIEAGIDALKKHIGGEYSAERYQETDASGILPWIIFIFFIVLDWLGVRLARSKSWWLGGALGGVFGIILTALFAWWISIPVLVLIGLFFDYAVSKKGYRRGRWGPGGFHGGWGGRGGGGFGGFGGGSTGGGGSHGRW